MKLCWNSRKFQYNLYHQHSMIVVNSDTTMIAWVIRVLLECLNIAMVPRQLESSATMLEQHELYADTAATLNNEYPSQP